MQGVIHSISLVYLIDEMHVDETGRAPVYAQGSRLEDAQAQTVCNILRRTDVVHDCRPPEGQTMAAPAFEDVPIYVLAYMDSEDNPCCVNYVNSMYGGLLDVGPGFRPHRRMSAEDMRCIEDILLELYHAHGYR